MSPNERTALAALVDGLRQNYGEDLLEVILFGSKARGDAGAESDLDVLVVLHMRDSDYMLHRQQILDLAYRLDLQHGVVLSLLIQDEARYTEMRRANLLLNRNIHTEGIPLWTSLPSKRTSKPA